MDTLTKQIDQRYMGCVTNWRKRARFTSSVGKVEPYRPAPLRISGMINPKPTIDNVCDNKLQVYWKSALHLLQRPTSCNRPTPSSGSSNRASICGQPYWHRPALSLLRKKLGENDCDRREMLVEVPDHDEHKTFRAERRPSSYWKT
jgi:hypothetical protein